MIANKIHVTKDAEYKHLYDTVYLPFFTGERVITSPSAGPLRDFYNLQLENYRDADNFINKSHWRNEAKNTLRLLYFSVEEKQADKYYAKFVRAGFKDPKFIRAWKAEISATAPCPVDQLYLLFKFEKCSRKYICILFNIINNLFGKMQYGKNTQDFLLLKMLIDGLYELNLPDEFYSVCIPKHELMVLREPGISNKRTGNELLFKRFPNLVP